MAAKERIIYFLYTGLTFIVCLGIYSGWKYLRQENPVPKIPASATSFASPSLRSYDITIRGSIPYWEEKAAFSAFQSQVKELESVSLFWYYLTPEGRLTTYKPVLENKTIIDFAHRWGKKVSLVVTNLPEENGTTWDSERVAGVITDNESSKAHIADLVNRAVKWDFDGVTIDYEELDRDLGLYFTRFIKDLAEALHAKGKFVGVALHPKTGTKSDRQYDFQNWQDLARIADELYIMAYGEHWDEGSPGPIASNSWVEEIISYTLSLDVPLSKFYLGIPLYGYDWTLDSGKKAKGLTYKNVRDLMLQEGIEDEWGEDSPAPFFRYIKDGRKHEVWFENAASVEEKLLLAQSTGFGGVTFWRLGDEDPEVWERVIKLTTAPTSPTGL